MAVISPGRTPVTRYEKDTMIQTANELFLYPEDIKSVDKQSIPVVIGYNNVKQHYVPTGVISPRMYTEFKLSCVAKLVDACLNMSSGVDTTYVPVKLLPQYANLKTSMLTFRSSFKDTQFTEHTAALTAGSGSSSSCGASLEGPIHNVSQASSVSVPLPSSTTRRKIFSRKDPSGKYRDPTTVRDDKGRKMYVCQECGVVKTKKNDYDSHVESAHGEGFHCPHSDKVLGYKRNLKKHVKTIHFQEFLYACDEEDCKYATDDKAAYNAHLISVHSAEQEEEHRCPKCNKNFSAKFLLDKHVKHIDCETTHKNFKCDLCTPPKGFKYKDTLDLHIQRYHTEEVPLIPCELCPRKLSTPGALQKHILWHRSIVRAKRIREIMREHMREQHRIKLRRTRPFMSLPTRIIASKQKREQVVEELRKHSTQ